ncbi:MAG TPA: NAD-dependent epimerase/dehydratase family protein [Mycobacterium sp.]|nr:NAD-dependent epimerase/dehydratase family protein [Mycobacterium sp.]
MRKRIVVIGASGNVGTALLRNLCGAGHQLVGVVRRPPEPKGVYGEAQWLRLDVADREAARDLGRVFDGADSVVHLAWGFQPTRNAKYLRSVGVGGTTAVLQAAQSAGVGQLIHMSSVGTYAAGRYGQRVTESWPTTGIASSAYSRDKSAAESLLDDYERTQTGSGVNIARMRPGFIVQRAAASGLLRYGLPGYIPMRAVPLLPLLPLDRDLCIPLVHADDVAEAIVQAIHRGASGPFNLAAEPPLRRNDVASALRSRPIHIPAGALGTLVDLSWRARLQPVDRGWLDLAFSVPLLDCSRARDELGWVPRWSSTEALKDVLNGIANRAHGQSAPLRKRSLLDELRRDATQGLISTRRIP